MLPPTLSRTSPRFNPNGRSVARQARRTRESVCPAPRRPIPKPTLSCCVESPSDLAPLRTVNVDQRTEARKKQLEKRTRPGTRIPGGDNGTIHCCFLPLKKSPGIPHLSWPALCRTVSLPSRSSRFSLFQAGKRVSLPPRQQTGQLDTKTPPPFLFFVFLRAAPVPP